MKVQLKCFSKLSEGDVCDYTGSNQQEISEGETVGSLISRLGFSHEEVKVIFLNGRIVDFDAVLGDGDQVGLAPPQLGFWGSSKLEEAVSSVKKGLALDLGQYDDWPNPATQWPWQTAPQDFRRKVTAILSADVKDYSLFMGEHEKATVTNEFLCGFAFIPYKGQGSQLYGYQNGVFPTWLRE